MRKSVITFDHPDYILRLEDMPHYILEHVKDAEAAKKIRQKK